MECVEVVFDFDQNCTLYELSEYICNAENIPELRDLSRDERQQKRDRDKAEFESWWLSYAYDCHAITAPGKVSDLELVCAFVEAHRLDAGRGFSTCDDLERLLKDAVDEDVIVPVMGRLEEQGYVPSSTSEDERSTHDWRPAPGGSPTLRSSAFESEQPLLSGAYDPALQEAKLKAARAVLKGDLGKAAGSGFNWLGSFEAVGDAVAGYAPGGADDECGRDSMLSNFGDSDGSGSLPDDAQPFEYRPDISEGEVFDLAKTPNEGDPGSWYTNSGSGQMRLYGESRQPVVDLDFDHDHGQGVPHAHNWSVSPLTGKNSRGAGVPFSLLP